jgi:conjugative relaxase-like TrwC/TraI family protein
MLSIARLASPEYYLQEHDYYAEGGDAVCVWLGRARGRLGLLGAVTEADLKALFEGVDPKDLETPLVQNAGSPSRRPGWDLTFSAPKSVSIVWALAPEPIRAAIAECHRRAVVAALNYLEDEAAFSRRGKGGKERDPCHLIVAAFEHSTSRAGDPELHIV